MMISRPAISAFLRLLTKPAAPLSVSNYMKTYQSHQVTRHHGYFKVDEYSHFDSTPAEVQKFIQAERQLYQKQSKKWQSITEEYYQISSSRRDSRTSTIPEIYDNYEYYTRVAWKNGREYSVIYRRPLLHHQKQEMVLDIMQYSAINRYHKTAQLVRTSFSPSHRYVAFGVDVRNNEKVSFFVADTHHPKKQLRKFKVRGQDVQSKIDETHDLIFASESTVYYTKMENYRPCRLIYHDLESGQSQEVLVEEDPQYYLNIRVSKDRKYLLVSANSKIKTKLWILDLQSPKRQLVKVWEDASKVYINHAEGHFILWLQANTSSIQLIEDTEIKSKIRTKGSQKQLNLKNLNHIRLYQCEEEESVEQIDIVKENVVLYINKINRPALKIINYKRQTQKGDQKQKFAIKVIDAKLPYEFGVITPGTNQNYNTNDIIFNVSTPFVYEQVYQYSISNNSFNVIQKYEHTGPKIPSHKYEIQHINVPSTTMDHIPLTIIGPKKRNIGKMIVHLYGFYGISSKITYDNVTIAALEKGWTVAYAHIRGGGEKGKKWHSEALGTNRERTWKDLQECIGYLIRQQYTHPSLLFINTSSAGAIAAWNAINRKPHLYKGAILRFPFLDVLNSLMDSSQPLSNADYEEFGNPIEDKSAYKTISAISPYENITTKEYPAIHIVAGQNDYRTPLSQIAKFSNRFRDRALQNGRFAPIGKKGLTVDISSTASHLGQASIKDQNYKGCDIFGYMDYVINQISHDCSIEKY